jgi:IS5 family transposase
LVIDANGNPLNFTLSKANWHDQRKILETIDGIKIGQRVRRPKRLGLDKGYDSEPLRQELRKRGIVPNPKYRKNHVTVPKGDRRKINTRSVTVGNVGKSKGTLPGLTTAIAWIAFLKKVKKLIALLCESISSDTTCAFCFSAF